MEIVANAVQTVTAGNSVIFTDTVVNGCASIVNRADSGLIKLRGLSNSQCRARFRASFGANIALPTGGSAGPISLTLTLDGEPLASTKMIVTPTAVNSYFNIATDVHIDVPIGCCATLSVRNTDGPDIIVQNASLIVERVA